MVDTQIIVAAIGGATTVICAFLTYLGVRLAHVTKLVDGTATLLAEQVQADKLAALARSDRLVAEAKEEKSNGH